jgi:hypothetical protein
VWIEHCHSVIKRNHCSSDIDVRALFTRAAMLARDNKDKEAISPSTQTIDKDCAVLNRKEEKDEY